MQIPITVWTYWENPAGLKTPSYLELCFDSMDKYCNTDNFVFKLVDNLNIHDLIPELRTDLNKLKVSNNPRENISIKADYIRAKLLQKYGGIWLDADTIVMRSPDELVPLLNRKDFLYRTQHEGLASVGVMASIPNGVLINEYIEQQDTLIDTKKTLSWGENGSRILTPLVRKHSAITQSLGLVGSIPFSHWQQYFTNVLYEHDKTVWCYQLYNKVFPEWFKQQNKEIILKDTTVISQLFRISLGV
ncbi:MAG TPA: capsular polysaccharide synthesis protein [Patescibacteria group bacterium]|nr:capsular polysaccharide synthesis protein [Patescibacteria group bacterium]